MILEGYTLELFGVLEIDEIKKCVYFMDFFH